MTTLLVIILIIALIVAIIQSKNYDDIMGLSRVELVEKKRKQSRKMLIVLVVSIAALVIGILLYKYTDMHKIVQVKTIFGKVKDARRWSESHYWACFLSIFGGLGTVIGLIGSLSNITALGKYNEMTDEAFAAFQDQTQKKQEENYRKAKQAKRGYKLGQFLSKILWG